MRRAAALAAREEAKRFLASVDRFLALSENETWSPSVQGGDLGRKSMDLTRSLARMRLSGRFDRDDLGYPRASE